MKRLAATRVLWMLLRSSLRLARRRHASLLSSSPTPQPPLPPPASHPHFAVIRSALVPEHSARATLYRHVPSGAELLSVVAAETEKVFGVSFATPPGDDTGVAHVLEHSVLCGSRLYPSKEPFVTLLASSLQTFLNAMTYPDRTVYAVASPHGRDFENLCRVYLDAALHPRLAPGVLEQEGWHLEVVDTAAESGGSGASADTASDCVELPPPARRTLRVSGVVLNEMKGVYSSGDTVHAMACDAALFPDTPYSRSSGGDPLAITALTPERFRAFHTQNYAPNRAKFFFFGDDSEASRLALIHEFVEPLVVAGGSVATETLQPPHPRALWLQAPFDAPRRVSLPYPAAAVAAPSAAEGAPSADIDAGAMISSSGGPGSIAGAVVSGIADAASLDADASGTPLERPVQPLAWDAPVATRTGYDPARALPPAARALDDDFHSVASDALPQGAPVVAATAVDEHFVTLSWCVGSAAGPGLALAAAPAPLSDVDRLGLGVLSHLLMGTPTSALRKALTDSGLGSSVTGGGLSDDALQPTFAAGLKGVRAHDARSVEPLVLHALTLAGGCGFGADAVDASLNTLEFRLREFSSGGGPRGLLLLLGSAGGWVHGRCPVGELGYAATLSELKARVAAAQAAAERAGEGNARGAYFVALLRERLLRNPHRATVHGWPDAEWAARRDAAERAWLGQTAAALDEGGWGRVAAAAAALRAAQAAPDAPEVLARVPTLRVRDMAPTGAVLRPVAAEPLPCPRGGARGSRVLLRAEEPTAGIGYVRVALDASHVPLALAPLLPLWAWAATHTGAGARNETALARALGASTGGLGVSVSAGDAGGRAAPGLALPRVVLSGKALAGRGGDLCDLARDVLLQARLGERGRIVAHLKERCARLEAGLSGSGQRFGGALLGASLSAAGWLGELWGGLAALRVARTLLHRIEGGVDGGWGAVEEDLRAITRTLVAGGPAVGAAQLSPTLRAALPLGFYPPIVATAIGDAVTLPEFSDALAGLVGALQTEGADGGGDGGGGGGGGGHQLASGWMLLRGGGHAAPTGSAAPLLPLWAHPRSAEEAEAAARVPGTSFGVTAAALRNVYSGSNGPPCDAPLWTPPGHDVGIVLPSSAVNYVVQAARIPRSALAPEGPQEEPSLVAYGVPQPLAPPRDAAPPGLAVAAAVLRTGHLWDTVRVRGGAYGAGVSLSRAAGVLTFSSYRDPHVGATLRAFRGAADALRGSGGGGGSAAASARLAGDCDKAVISTIGALDAPLSPQERGDAAAARWAGGGSVERDQRAREGILRAGAGDCGALAHALDACAREGVERCAVAGPEAALSAWAAEGGAQRRPLLTLRPLA